MSTPIHWEIFHFARVLSYWKAVVHPWVKKTDCQPAEGHSSPLCQDPFENLMKSMDPLPGKKIHRKSYIQNLFYYNGN